MNIKELTIEQIKALKCDHYENIARSQQTLAMINAELEERVKQNDDGKVGYKSYAYKGKPVVVEAKEGSTSSNGMIAE